MRATPRETIAGRRVEEKQSRNVLHSMMVLWSASQTATEHFTDRNKAGTQISEITNFRIGKQEARRAEMPVQRQALGAHES